MNGKTKKTDMTGRQQITRVPSDFWPGSWVAVIPDGTADPLCGAIREVSSLHCSIIEPDQERAIWRATLLPERRSVEVKRLRLATDDEIRRAPWVRRAAA